MIYGSNMNLCVIYMSMNIMECRNDTICVNYKLLYRNSAPYSLVKAHPFTVSSCPASRQRAALCTWRGWLCLALLKRNHPPSTRRGKAGIRVRAPRTLPRPLQTSYVVYAQQIRALRYGHLEMPWAHDEPKASIKCPSLHRALGPRGKVQRTA